MASFVTDKLKTPAIGLIVAGALNLLTGVYLIFSAMVQVAAGAMNQSFKSDAERFGYYVGFWLPTGCAVLSLLLAPIIIYGAINMLRGHKYKLAKTAAILAVIPFTSCCLLAGIPFGIWALAVLGKPEVKAYFQGGTNQTSFYPPQPPSF